MNNDKHVNDTHVNDTQVNDTQVNDTQVNGIHNINYTFQFFTWSKGEKNEQSTQNDKVKYIINTETTAEDYNNMKHLLFEDGTNSCMRVSNKREDANTKLNERSMIEHVGLNPFHSQNNYLNDLKIQDEFLKPKNSNFNIE